MCFKWFKKKPATQEPPITPPIEPYVREVPSPRDIISGGAITKSVRQKALLIHLSWSIDSVKAFPIADTNSMDGLLDFGHHILATDYPDEIAAAQTGDVIIFKRDAETTKERLICHQIVEEGRDDIGIYFKTKGIRNLTVDPEKVRTPDIVGVGFGIIW